MMWTDGAMLSSYIVHQKEDLIKDFILRNYSLKKSNSSISNVLNAQTFIKIYYLRFLKSGKEAPVIISQICIR
jgi:hypothetical protein